MPSTHGRSGRRAVPAAQAAEHADEHFLGHVFGVVQVASSRRQTASTSDWNRSTSSRHAAGSPVQTPFDQRGVG